MKNTTIVKRIWSISILSISIFILVFGPTFFMLNKTQNNLFNALNTRTSTLDLMRAMGVDSYQIDTTLKSLFLLDNTSEKFKEYLSFVDYNIAQIDKRLLELKTSHKDISDEEATALKSFEDNYIILKSLTSEICNFAKGSEDDRIKGATLLNNEFTKTFLATEDSIDVVADTYVKNGQALSLKQKKANTTVILSLLLLLTIGLLVTFSQAFIVTKNISKNFDALMGFLKNIKETGNLKDRLSINSNDELEFIGTSINEMIDEITKLLDSITLTSDKLSKSSSQLELATSTSLKSSENTVHTMNDLMDTSTRQFASITQSKDNLISLSSSVVNMVSSTSQIKNLAETTNTLTNKGIETVKILTTTSTESVNSVKDIDELIKIIVNSSEELDNLTYKINSISEQTNLLSLNASIEAARAGSQGAGFAIVASEIGHLANESSQLSSESKIQIDNMVSKVSSAVSSIESLKKNFVNLEITVKENEEIFSKILESVSDVKEEITKLNSNNSRVEKDTRFVVDKMTELYKLIEKNKASINSVYELCSKGMESSKNVKDETKILGNLSVDLNETVNKFKV
ncbi:MAG: methyl-accepting chemotaxis protein [Sarcina sp.]